jgi:hypothetical protein
LIIRLLSGDNPADNSDNPGGDAGGGLTLSNKWVNVLKASSVLFVDIELYVWQLPSSLNSELTDSIEKSLPTESVFLLLLL